jgi:hypothetical protein
VEVNNRIDEEKKVKNIPFTKLFRNAITNITQQIAGMPPF